MCKCFYAFNIHIELNHMSAIHLPCLVLCSLSLALAALASFIGNTTGGASKHTRIVQDAPTLHFTHMNIEPVNNIQQQRTHTTRHGVLDDFVKRKYATCMNYEMPAKTAKTRCLPVLVLLLLLLSMHF